MSERRLILIRHGQTEYNATGRMQGQLDTDLSETGLAQVQAAAQVVADWPVSTVVASDLRRARDTANVLAARWGVPVATDARLRETDLGRWQAASHHEIDRDYPGQRAYWRHDPTWAPPGGETRLQVADRAEAVVRELLAGGAFDGGHVVLVAHGGTIAALTARLLGVRHEDYPMLSGLGNVCWAQLVARPRFMDARDHAPHQPAVDGSTVPMAPALGKEAQVNPRWHLEGWNVGVNAAAPMSAPSPDEGGEDAPS
ncbi:histidine phosphatase family protein [Corynebacterium heidelbergense]|uniref:Histidine phosphatase family protein n=1 Tax=Corynebacterium heidelbergense TaxID=2055947 RepID=A0A364VAQ7_9CORY|nr:histidine phosphatase family protein [Corynebacterium heidelbergense]RAV33694.1 histidine phosphatase family protein [Corynebacterium heidelbergense]WCZ36223.1 Glucosyl-3-phosphoglycerate phosphatase [Corynebacterium heidelbergense]